MEFLAVKSHSVVTCRRAGKTLVGTDGDGLIKTIQWFTSSTVQTSVSERAATNNKVR